MFGNVPCSWFYRRTPVVRISLDKKLYAVGNRETSCIAGFHVVVDKTRNMEHSGTFRNIPEHSGTSRNIPEHPGTSNNYDNYDKNM